MYRSYRPPSIWREMDRLQREMNRLFNGYSPNRLYSAPSYPAINVWANEDGLLVNAEMPGVQVDGIDVSVDGKTLTISGERMTDELPEGARYHRKERRFGDFSRTIQLPIAVNSEQVVASFSDGVLTINLPGAESEKPKKIAIQS
jgi:HSP20 family protein